MNNIIFIILILTGCTVNLQNTDTHGSTQDLIDEQMSNQPTLTANLENPMW